MSLNTHAKVAVLLAAYNGEKWIVEQIDTILAQRNVEVTLFISVDISIDGTENLVNRLALHDKRLVILPHGKKFGGAGLNFFRLISDVDFGCFDYIAFADQDDIWFDDKLSSAVRVITDESTDAYSSNVIAFWPNGVEKLINKSQPQVQWDFILESAGPGCTFVLSKKVAVDLQNFLIANAHELAMIEMHDWFIYAFARSRGFKWYIDFESHMLYRQHANNVLGANVGFKANLARWSKLREGWLIDQALIIAKVLGYANAWPIKKLQRQYFLDRILLVANVNKLRRRLRDRIALVIFLLLPFKN